ncbi:ATPase with role in protein import into the ER [Cadophora gregata]|uniref:ATPase with role in protein import into the ER n=1 Tax=Cadophora gregata TaxID=51156 RepID=UPI0026DC2E5B|nr:ATPase with role in protein import into the ER [Cadophora gregata]KAK0125865.1 ATPase with role in protein import into the ER [Cadophora gregata]
MTTIKIQSQDNPTTQKPLASKKLSSTDDSVSSGARSYTLLAVLGVFVAISAALILNWQKVQHDTVVPSTYEVSKMTQAQEVEQQPPPYCGNAYDDEYINGCVLAIEIGESYSRVGAPINSSVQVFDIDGQQKMPNYVAYTDHGILVGQEAKDQAEGISKNTIFDVRRIIGRRFSTDPSLQRDIDSLPYDVVMQDDKPIIKVHLNGQEKFITPEEVHMEVLKKLKTVASNYYGQDVNSTIFTVPAYFNDNQRQATKDAGVSAGFEVLRLVNEPTAAAIAHHVDRQDCTNDDCEEFIVVYNLGENHVDITVSSIEMGVFEILGMANDRSVCGQKFDDTLLDYVSGKVQTTSKVDPDSSLGVLASLKREVKKAEVALSAQSSAMIDYEGVTLTITQNELQTLHKSLFDKSVEHIGAVLKDAKLQKTNISHLIITGNTAQVSKMQPFLEAFFDGKKAHSLVPSDQAILQGAAHQAEIFSSGSGSDWVGAFDISVLSLGIETNGGLYEKIIPRNTVMPKRSTVNVTTINDNQTKIVFNIFEGERPFVVNNKLFGTFNVTNLTPRPAGELIVEVTFEFDPNGILTVIARDWESGKKTFFVSHDEPQSRYDDVDSIVMEAEMHADEDYSKISAINEKALWEDRDEFGIDVVYREGEMPRAP